VAKRKVVFLNILINEKYYPRNINFEEKRGKTKLRRKKRKNVRGDGVRQKDSKKKLDSEKKIWWKLAERLL